MLFSKKPPDQKESDPAPRGGLFKRLGRALKAGLTYDLNQLFSRHQAVDDLLLEEVETLLLSADVGVDATQRLMSGLQRRRAGQRLTDVQGLRTALRDDMLEILSPVAIPLAIPARPGKPFVILMVGVNGSGKTTTIGKLSERLRRQGRSVMLAAGDTFRAAAIEQLQSWGKRNNVPVIAQHTGADSASVIYDAVQAATSRGVEVLIADTAGRLQTQQGLMEELKKVRRVVNKLDPEAPHETMLVVDAGTGQNALSQAGRFQADVGVSGVTMTKLDGTAKGGVVLAMAEQFGIPIRFVGLGEGIDDLEEFNAQAFVEALLSE